MKIKIKYFDNAERLDIFEQGDWVDLKVGQDTTIQTRQQVLIPLGVAMKLPKGYEAVVVPRSSTSSKYNLIQANSFGVIDNSYQGDNDQWYFPVINLGQTITLKKGTRICQFRILKSMPSLEFEEVDSLKNKDRGGFGSTGK